MERTLVYTDRSTCARQPLKHINRVSVLEAATERRLRVRALAGVMPPPCGLLRAQVAIHAHFKPESGIVLWRGGQLVFFVVISGRLADTSRCGILLGKCIPP